MSLMMFLNMCFLKAGSKILFIYFTLKKRQVINMHGLLVKVLSLNKHK